MSYLVNVNDIYFDFAKLNKIMKTSVADQTDKNFNDNMNILKEMGEIELIEAFKTDRSNKIKTKKMNEKERKIHAAKQHVEMKKIEIRYIDELIHICIMNKTHTNLARCIAEKKALEVELNGLQIFHKNLVNETVWFM